jgi:hypothetical protein
MHLNYLFPHNNGNVIDTQCRGMHDNVDRVPVSLQARVFFHHCGSTRPLRIQILAIS